MKIWLLNIEDDESAYMSETAAKAAAKTDAAKSGIRIKWRKVGYGFQGADCYYVRPVEVNGFPADEVIEAPTEEPKAKAKKPTAKRPKK